MKNGQCYLKTILVNKIYCHRYFKCHNLYKRSNYSKHKKTLNSSKVNNNYTALEFQVCNTVLQNNICRFKSANICRPNLIFILALFSVDILLIHLVAELPH